MGRYIQVSARRRKKQVQVQRRSAIMQEISLKSRGGRKGKKINAWDPHRMERAVQEYVSTHGRQCQTKPDSSIRQLARAWGVPYATFRRRILGIVKGSGHESGRNTVLPDTAEKELANTITGLARVGFPLTREEVRKLAFEFAEKNGLKGFSKKKQQAGYYWFVGFMSRHPEISVRKTENLSVSRAMAMNHVQVDKWFTEYETMVLTMKVTDPSHIWNVDEIGMQNIYVTDKVVAGTGENAYSITAGEKGETSTVVVATNAVGDVVPPVVIHKGKIVGKCWKNGAPLDSLVIVSPNGWITKEIFVQFGAMFLKFLQKKNLLKDDCAHVVVLDNHYSHLFNLEFLNMMKENNVHVIGLPPHTSHWLQPLDRVNFGVLKKAWNKEMRTFTHDTVGKRVEKSDFFRVFSPAFDKAMTVENAQSAFRCTGLYPLNRNAIPKDAYNPSTVFDRPLTTLQTPDQSTGVDHTVSAAASASHFEGDTNASVNGVPATTDSSLSDTVTAVSEICCDSAPSSVMTDQLTAATASAAATNSGQSSFADLVTLPRRERPVAKRPRAKPPQFEMTSQATMEFVESRSGERLKKNKRKEAKPLAVGKTTAAGKKQYKKATAKEKK